jgi:hypothetical protein
MIVAIFQSRRILMIVTLPDIVGGVTDGKIVGKGVHPLPAKFVELGPALQQNFVQFFH